MRGLWSGAGRHSQEHAQIVARTCAFDHGVLLCFMQVDDKVGVLDTTSNTFSTIDLTAGISHTSGAFAGAAVLGNKVYFAPYVSAASRPVCLWLCTCALTPSLGSSIACEACGVLVEWREMAQPGACTDRRDESCL